MKVVGWLLVMGICTDGEVKVIHDLGAKYYETLAECEEVINTSTIRETYKELFEGKDLRMWCEPIKR